MRRAGSALGYDAAVLRFRRSRWARSTQHLVPSAGCVGGGRARSAPAAAAVGRGAVGGGERSGRGARVDTSLLGAAMALQEPVLRGLVFQRERGRRMGRPLWGPLDTPVRTAGGWLAVDLAGEDARLRLARSLGADPSEGDARLAAHLAARTAAEWEARLHAAGVPAAVVREELSALPGDPRVAGLLERVEDACWMPAAPWRLEA